MAGTDGGEGGKRVGPFGVVVGGAAVVLVPGGGAGGGMVL